MIVSWNWLKDYVRLDMPVEEFEQRMMMAGLNHEETIRLENDWAIDLEVTSNRPDCLGHLGVAREVAVLWGQALKIPEAQPQASGSAVEDLVRVRIDCPELCERYTARVIRGVKVGPSPDWLANRLDAVGITPVNNIVDISNYVLLECGQPLHTFDLAKLQGGEIIVREPKPKETIEAIDHREYELEPGMCIIADVENPVAIGGVMGGAATEIGRTTKDILVEAAEFDPLAIRNAARRLNLHSDSSYRFERRIDSGGIDWASRRCCEMILDLAGGELCEGVIDVGPQPPARESVTLRIDQVERILGIEVPVKEIRTILTKLGNEEVRADAERIEVIPPTWRRDLTREIDLVEEVARIHGYEKIPQNVGVAMTASVRRFEDRVASKIRGVLTALGYDEAVTLSAVDLETSQAFSPWSDQEPLQTITPILRGADRLRKSLVPSLLSARKTNEALSNEWIELFEIAKVYLPQSEALPIEEPMLALVSCRDFLEVKGAIESVLAALNPKLRLEIEAVQIDQLDPAVSGRLLLNGKPIGYLGQLSQEGLKRFDLRRPATVAEVSFPQLLEATEAIPQYQPLPAFPAMTRDLNFVVDESVRWTDLAATVREHAGDYYEDLHYADTYRDADRLGAGKKSLLMTLVLRSSEGTLTSQESDQVRDQIVEACKTAHSAELRA